MTSEANDSGAKNTMKRNSRGAAALIAAALAAAAISACGKTSEAPPPPSAAAAANDVPSGQRKDQHAEASLRLSPEERESAGLQVTAIRAEEITGKVSATATIRANQDRFAQVSPRVSGKIMKVLASTGDRVAAGQTLALVDSIEVGEAQSAWLQARSEESLARANFERLEKLYAEQIVSEKDYLRAKAEYEKARAVLRAASEKRQMLGAGEASPASSVSVYPLTAPFAGTVIDKKAVLGDLAQPDKPLFAVADLGTVWIEASLFEKDLGKVSVGAPAHVSVAAYPDETFRGRVAYVSSVMDRETRTAKARVEVPNRDGRLKLEMFATVAIDAPGRRKAITLPEEAVLLVQGVPTVFVQEGEGFQPRPIDPGEKLRGRIVVNGGLKEGDRVAVRGAYALKAKLLKSQIGDEH